MRITNREGKKRGLLKSVLRNTGAAAALATLIIMSPVSDVKPAWALEGAQCVEFGFKDGKYDACNKWYMASHKFGLEARSQDADPCQQDYDKGYQLGFTEGKLTCEPRSPAVVSYPVVSAPEPTIIQGGGVVGGGGVVIGPGGGGSVTNEFVNNGNVNNGGQQNVNNGGNQSVNNGGIQNGGTQVTNNNGGPGNGQGGPNVNNGGQQNANNGGNQKVNNGGIQNGGTQVTNNNGAPGGQIVPLSLTKKATSSGGVNSLVNKAAISQNKLTSLAKLDTSMKLTKASKTMQSLGKSSSGMKSIKSGLGHSTSLMKSASRVNRSLGSAPKLAKTAHFRGATMVRRR